MTRTAIIGSSSFLANYIISDLEKENHELTLFSRNIANNTHLHSAFDYPNTIPDYSIFLSYDIIIFAAAGGVQSSQSYSLDEIYALNSFLPISIVNFLDENSFKGKFISFGSYFEIGGQDKLNPYTEIDVALSNFEVPNHYCSSKRLLTRFVNDSLSKIDHYHIILPSIYGKNENENRLIPYLISSIENQRNLELTAGTQIRQFLHAKDVSTFVTIICKQTIEKGIYNLGSDNYNRVKDVVETIFNHFGQDSSTVLGKIKRQDESMQVLLLDDSKARKMGWKPQIDLKEGILDYFKNN